MERLLFHRGRFSIVAGEIRLYSAISSAPLRQDFFGGGCLDSVRSICSLEGDGGASATHMLRQLYVPQRLSWNFFGNVAVVPDDFPGDTRWP
jgi:hypothetical protein